MACLWKFAERNMKQTEQIKKRYLDEIKSSGVN